MNKIKKLFLVLLCSFSTQIFAGCNEDSLMQNNNGEILKTLSGQIFETLAGDNITSLLWLPTSSFLICGPETFKYKGKNFQLYKISNTDDGETITAFKIAGGSMSSSGDCFESSIIKPSPFMGNHGEIFKLDDGSIWEIQGEYEYMYEYYPSLTACPSKGLVIVDGKKLNATRMK